VLQEDKEREEKGTTGSLIGKIVNKKKKRNTRLHMLRKKEKKEKQKEKRCDLWMRFEEK
jgi:hypothetical protein